MGTGAVMLLGTRLGRLGLLVACLLLVVPVALGSAPSGNDVLRDLKLAKKPAERKAIIDEALGKQHFLRYLSVQSLSQGDSNGAPFIDLMTKEPSSGMTVKFKVVKTQSLIKLKEAPETQVGDAVAVTGVIQSVDPVKWEMVLSPVIVRFKDRASPKMGGREMVYEVDSAGIVYSFTGGKEPVNVSKRDEDLVQNEAQMLEKLGKEGWAKYLKDEIAKRDEAAKIERNKLNVYRKEKDAGLTNAPAAPVQNVITEDED